MKLDKDRESLQTTLGSIFTLIVYLIVGAYAYQKTTIWYFKEDVDIW